MYYYEHKYTKKYLFYYINTLCHCSYRTLLKDNDTLGNL